MSTDTPARPDPDALLEGVREGEDLAGRARLKIFLGAAPGVGKTYAMLVEAHELHRAGVDVVAGIVETHGRAETTALLEGLERIPPKRIDYRGTTVHEFDLDAALARRPGLLLLDELAHTNAPGVRHAKRWQDVRDLLAAGIPVATTLNVQHVESLNDVVEQLTHVRVRESVPDSVLDRADEIELVDLPADDLLQRLREGKVYLPDRAEKALANFFTKGNLLALRELALRRAAERVGRQVDVFRRAQGERRAPSVRERVLVCLGDPATGPALVRAGRRLADALSADWWVLHVQSPVEPGLGDGNQRAVLDVLGFAEDLGAQTAIVGGHSAADEIAAYAREQRIARIVIGRSTRSRWRRLLRGTLAAAVGDRVPSADVLVVPVSREDSAARPEPQTPRRHATASDWLRGVAVVLVCTGLGFLMRSRFELTNIVMVYLLGVALVAVTSGRGPSILASILSVAAFDFCFVRPMFTFAVSDTQYVVTFGVMLVVAVALSTMAARLREQAEFARSREARVAGLLGLSRKLAVAATPERLLEAAASSVRDLTGVDAFVVATEADGRLLRVAIGGGEALDERDHAVAQWVRDHGEPAGRGTATLPASRLTFFPLVATRGVLGVLGLAFPDDTRIPPDRMRLLRAATDQIGLALERAQLADEAEDSRVQAAGERTRSALLASVSHDLRTPLAVIQGAATTLLERASTTSPAGDRELIATIVDESDRLNRLVADLLDMTRLDSGVEPKRDWQSVEELLGAALASALRGDEARPVRVCMPPAMPLVRVDAVLLTQALIHLIENARAHTPGGTPIEVDARVDGADVEIEVRDRGPGIRPGDEERIFDKFYRGAQGDAGPPGSGLGLAICRAIVELHGGTIVARNRSEGGATFRIRLPRGGEPPAAPETVEASS